MSFKPDVQKAIDHYAAMAPEVSLVVKHFPPDWLIVWTPNDQVAFHIPTGEIMPMSDERCPVIVIDWSRKQRK